MSYFIFLSVFPPYGMNVFFLHLLQVISIRLCIELSLLAEFFEVKYALQCLHILFFSSCVNGRLYRFDSLKALCICSSALSCLFSAAWISAC